MSLACISLYDSISSLENKDHTYATMLIILPSEHAGGTISLSQHGLSFQYNPSQATEHPSVLAWRPGTTLATSPVSSGTRLALVYTLASPKKLPRPRTVDTTAYAAHVPNTIALLESCPRALADLRIALRMWDEEILYAVAQLLPDLERLEVWYHGGCPKDTFVMSLGTQLIPRMPRLRVLKVFPLPGAGGAADATDAARADDMHNENRWKPVQRGVFTRAQVRGFLSAWTRYCPALAEVKLAPSSYWVRDATGVDWECIGE